MKLEPERFQLWHPVEVRFRDIDVGGHAHHSMVLIYFEEARARYWRDVVRKGDVEDIDFILAEARVRYHARIMFPLVMNVGVRVSKLGKKHFLMEYLAVDPQGEPLASGETTMVMFDYEARRSKNLQPEVAAAIRSHEGGMLS